MNAAKIILFITCFPIILLLAEGCKTAEITYLGFITTQYPSKKSLVADSVAAKAYSDTVIRARAVVQLLGYKLTDFSRVQKGTEKGYFDTLYPRKYEFIIRSRNDSLQVTVGSLDSITRPENIVSGDQQKTMTIQGYVYQGDMNTPSQNTFIILTSVPKKRSTYTNSSGSFEFENVNLSDLSLRVFDQRLSRFIDIPLRVRNLSTFNQFRILLTGR
jgi:hypothetical protein